MKFKSILLLCVLLSGAVAHAGALLKPTTGATQALRAKNLDVKADINGAFAQTTVTTIYDNPNDDRIEADFIYTAPENAVVTGFAYWYGDEKVVARIVEKERAAQIYGYITSRMRDPALVEMIGKNTFRARIFPVEPRTDLKIEVQFAQTLAPTSSGWLWSFPLREETKNAALDNFKLRVDVADKRRARTNLGTLNGDNSLQIARENFKAGDDARVEVTAEGSLRHELVSARDGGADGFFALAAAGDAAPKISGIQTYDIVTVRGKNAVFTMGRYRNAGAATATVSAQEIALKFGDAVEKNNVASQLWAAGRIEELSKKSANKNTTIALSKRFGMPSKWTSWLAIPEEERQRYKLEKAQADVDLYGNRYAQLVANGQTKAARQTKVQFEQADKTLRKLGGYGRSNLQEFLNSHLDNLIYEKQKASTKRKREIKSLDARLRRAGAKSNAEARIAQTANYHYMSDLFERWQNSMSKNGAAAPQTRRIVEEMRRWDEKKNLNWNVESQISYAYRQQSAKWTTLIAKAIGAGEENTPAARKLWDDLRDWQERAGDNWGDEEIARAYHFRAHNRAYRLAETKSLSPDDKAQIAQLKRELEESVAARDKYTKRADNQIYLPNYVGFSSVEELIDSETGVLNYAQATSKLENRYRPGDPLISVAAPENCQRVVAILPSGELLPLVYDAAKKAWEARFDVPTYANEGAYKVQLIIVAANGARQQMTMTFHVDVTAPDGKGGAIFGADGLNLQLQTDDQTDRVSAFTPWGARIELRRNVDGIFVARADVPQNWQNKSAKIRFILTDEAHNRTEIEVDWSE